VQNNRVALTGASGMLGRAIIKQLANRSDTSLLAIYRTDPPPSAGNITNCMANLDRPDEIARALHEFNPTVLIHTAATGMQQPRPDETTLRKVNVELPARLAEAASALDGCHFVHISSGLAYKDQGRPLREDDPLDTIHPYGASKAEAEGKLRAAAQDRHLHLTILRPFSFTGEGDFGTRLFPSLLRGALEKKPFEMSAGDQVRDHATVNDIARGVIAAAFAHSKQQPAIFNLGSGDTRTLRELVISVTRDLSIGVDVRFGARAYSPHEQMFMAADITSASRKLGWQPRENIAQAVWELASSSFPALKIDKPKKAP
jgi:UDP-glucose 4-epimerase